MKPQTSWRGAAKLIILEHERDKKGDFGKRVLMHIPVGLVAGIPILGYPVLKLFIFYEDNEDLHIKDEAWKDTFGAIIGAAITALAATGVVQYGCSCARKACVMSERAVLCQLRLLEGITRL